MKMHQLVSDDLKINYPLPWNVYDASGRLLLCKGYLVTHDAQVETLLSRGMFVDEEAFKNSAPVSAPEPEKFNPFRLWEDVQAKLLRVLRSAGKDPGFSDQIANLAKVIQTLTEKDGDAGICVMLQHDVMKYTISHMIHAAIVTDLVSKHIGWSSGDRLVAISAAITMNIGMLDLQTTLVHQREPLTEEQKKEINLHPERGFEMLQAAGVNQQDWLIAVRDHHENRAGKGYPYQRSDSSEVANLLHLADVFSAKVSPRAYRKSIPANQAARDIFLGEGEQGKNSLCAAIIKEIGIYPPGSFVKLANGETAVVVRRGASAHTPLVASLSNNRGAPFVEPIERDTSRKEYGITAIVPRSNVVIHLNTSKIWGYE